MRVPPRRLASAIWARLTGRRPDWSMLGLSPDCGWSWWNGRIIGRSTCGGRAWLFKVDARGTVHGSCLFCRWDSPFPEDQGCRQLSEREAYDLILAHQVMEC